jgi:hypothetical protein
MHWAEGWTPGGQCDFWRSSGIVTLGAVYLDFAMLTERSRRRKVVPMVGGAHRSRRRRRRRIAMLASAFVARWCASSKIETAGGVYRVREGEPAASLHLVRGPCSDAFAFLFAD